MAATGTKPIEHLRMVERGLPAHTLTWPCGSACTVYEFGACMTSFVDADGVERLFVSPTAVFDGVKAIRGGVPIIFPQFGPDGPLPNHGFARTSNWTFDGVDDDRAVFSLTDSERTRAIWDHPFQLRMAIRLGAHGFQTSLEVRNTGASEFEYQALLHTYHALEDAVGASVTGLDGREFVDKLDSQAVKTQRGDVVIDREVDRIYRLCPSGEDAGPVVVSKSSAGAKSIVVRCSSSVGSGSSRVPSLSKCDVVVWNPWVEKSASLVDLPDDGFRSFVCVEPGCVDGKYALAAGSSMILSQSVAYE